MRIQMKNGLPVLNITIEYHTKTMILENVLLDTGCAVSVFDTDTVEEVGLTIDRNSGRAIRMYGVGGKSELCYQQNAEKNNHKSNPFNKLYHTTWNDKISLWIQCYTGF